MKDKLWNKYKRLPIEVLEFKELRKHKNHRRLTVFYNKGLQCSNPNCNKVGKFLILTDQCNKKGKIIGRHLDVYTKDLELMTVDHIIPKSKGGPMTLENLRPMCSRCNMKLGNSQQY